MTRSDAGAFSRPRPRRTHRAVALAVCVSLALGAGCTSARRDLPAPRTADAGTLEREAQASPASPEPLYQLALLHYAESRPEPALAALDASLDRDAQYAPSLALLAKLLHETGRSRDGIRWFEKRGLDTLPEPVRLNVALLYADAGNTVKARKILATLGSGAWADAAQVNLAYLDLLDEDPAAAATRLAGGTGRYGDDPATRTNRALVALRTGDAARGARLVEELAAAYPELRTAQSNLELVLRHYLLDAEGADRVQAHLDAVAVPGIGDAAWQEFTEPAHEDAAPPVPAATPRPGGGGA